MIGSIPRLGERGDGGQPDRACADHDRNLAGLHVGGADVELTNRERVGQRDGIVGDIAVDRLGQCLGDHHQFAEAALRVGVLADDSRCRRRRR